LLSKQNSVFKKQALKKYKLSNTSLDNNSAVMYKLNEMSDLSCTGTGI